MAFPNLCRTASSTCRLSPSLGHVSSPSSSLLHSTIFKIPPLPASSIPSRPRSNSLSRPDSPPLTTLIDQRRPSGPARSLIPSEPPIGRGSLDSGRVGVAVDPNGLKKLARERSFASLSGNGTGAAGAATATTTGGIGAGGPVEGASKTGASASSNAIRNWFQPPPQQQQQQQQQPVPISGSMPGSPTSIRSHARPSSPLLQSTNSFTRREPPESPNPTLSHKRSITPSVLSSSTHTYNNNNNNNNGSSSYHHHHAHGISKAALLPYDAKTIFNSFERPPILPSAPSFGNPHPTPDPSVGREQPYPHPSHPTSALSSLFLHVLPLFNGSPLSTSLESLNSLVKNHIQSTFTRYPSRAIPSLITDLKDILGSGMLTLQAKLQGVTDGKLIGRLVELWVFFWSAIVPLVEGIFLPLGSDPLILNAHSARPRITSDNSRSKRPAASIGSAIGAVGAGSANFGPGLSSSTSSSSAPVLRNGSFYASSLPTMSSGLSAGSSSKAFETQPIDVRQHLLTLFLLSILRALVPRTVKLLVSPEEVGKRSPPSQQQLARLQQMALILMTQADPAIVAGPETVTEPTLATSHSEDTHGLRESLESLLRAVGQASRSQTLPGGSRPAAAGGGGDGGVVPVGGPHAATTYTTLSTPVKQAGVTGLGMRGSPGDEEGGKRRGWIGSKGKDGAGAGPSPLRSRPNHPSPRPISTSSSSSISSARPYGPSGSSSAISPKAATLTIRNARQAILDRDPHFSKSHIDDNNDDNHDTTTTTTTTITTTTAPGRLVFSPVDSLRSNSSTIHGLTLAHRTSSSVGSASDYVGSATPSRHTSHLSLLDSDPNLDYAPTSTSTYASNGKTGSTDDRSSDEKGTPSDRPRSSNQPLTEPQSQVRLESQSLMGTPESLVLGRRLSEHDKRSEENIDAPRSGDKPPSIVGGLRRESSGKGKGKGEAGESEVGEGEKAE
ncbi:HbrB-like [Phaffia rhodozyma]|uniref:HbrB-like n=1 Tax=Phaffia rhodozyma TaxID=264483 RepID=A0A0F7SJ23_PHARH|nr:HbrB-like [Phaffia rhodozyma]